MENPIKMDDFEQKKTIFGNTPIEEPLVVSTRFSAHGTMGCFHSSVVPGGFNPFETYISQIGPFLPSSWMRGDFLTV